MVPVLLLAISQELGRSVDWLLTGHTEKMTSQEFMRP